MNKIIISVIAAIFMAATMNAQEADYDKINVTVNQNVSVKRGKKQHTQVINNNQEVTLLRTAYGAPRVGLFLEQDANGRITVLKQYNYLRGPYAQAAAGYGIGNGATGHIEFGYKFGVPRLGVQIGAGQRTIDGLSFLSQTAGLKIGFDLFKQKRLSVQEKQLLAEGKQLPAEGKHWNSVYVSPYLLAGYCHIQQKTDSEVAHGKTQKHFLRVGGGMNVHLFRYFFAGVEYSGFMDSKKITERVTADQIQGTVTTTSVLVNKNEWEGKLKVFIGFNIDF